MAWGRGWRVFILDIKEILKVKGRCKDVPLLSYIYI